MDLLLLAYQGLDKVFPCRNVSGFISSSLLDDVDILIKGLKSLENICQFSFKPYYPYTQVLID